MRGREVMPMVMKAFERGAATVLIPPGDYRFGQVHGQRQYALFAGLNKQGSACGHVSENSASYETFPKDQYYNPPEGEPISVKVLRESADERVELREHRFTKIEVTRRGGKEVARNLVALRLNPW